VRRFITALPLRGAHFSIHTLRARLKSGNESPRSKVAIRCANAVTLFLEQFWETGEFGEADEIEGVAEAGSFFNLAKATFRRFRRSIPVSSLLCLPSAEWGETA
jgi:hypothetical protein